MSSLRARRIARNPLAFPGGNPGFNPAHPAAGTYCFSAAPIGAAMVNLYGQGGTINAGPLTAGIDATIGPVCTFTTSQSITGFNSVPLTAFPGTTFAAIVIWQSGNGAFFSNTGSGVNGLSLGVSTAAVVMNVNGGAGYVGANTLTANVPYFVAACVYDNSKTIFVITNLNTGVVKTEVVTTGAAAQTAPTTGYRINRTGGGSSPAAKYARLMYSNATMSQSSLLAWAADPWSLWIAPQ